MSKADDVLLNKTATITRCIKRIHEEYDGKIDIRTDYTRQDSVILNLQRCCEAAIDMGNRLIRLRDFGIPQSSRDVFKMLQQEKIIGEDTADSLMAMVGLRNIAVHDYQSLNLDIIIHIIENNLQDFEKYCRDLLAEQSKKQ